MPDMSGGDGMNDMPVTVTMMMQMSFYWGKDAIILFSGWPNGRLGMYVLALLFIFLLAVAVAVEVLSALPVNKPGMSAVAGGFVQAVVHTVRMGLAYLVMLSVMSFNLGVFFVAVAGHGVGFFVVKARALAAARGGGAAGASAGTPDKV